MNGFVVRVKSFLLPDGDPSYTDWFIVVSDGDNDCSDSNDEANCSITRTFCDSDSFKCKNGKCIRWSGRCGNKNYQNLMNSWRCNIFDCFQMVKNIVRTVRTSSIVRYTIVSGKFETVGSL